MSFKEYTELNKEKRELWLDFNGTLKDINQSISGIVDIMKLAQATDNLVKDYWETAKKEVKKGKYWNSLDYDQQQKLIRYWAYEKARIENNFIDTTEQLERQSQEYLKEIELAKLQAQLEQKKQEAQQQCQLQQEHLISLTPLVDNPAVHSFFTDLLNTYAKKFAASQNIDISHLPVTFGGFYYDPKTGDGLGTMGQCFFHQITYPHHAKEIEITLNRLYLLNKFNHDRYFTTHPQHGDYYYIDISFDKMIDTCSHELAHYIQFIKYGKSSCKSDLKLGRKTYNPELAQEHKKFTKQIYQMIKNSGEYSEWEKLLKEIKQ